MEKGGGWLELALSTVHKTRDVNDNTSSSIIKLRYRIVSIAKRKRLKMLNTDRKENKNVQK